MIYLTIGATVADGSQSFESVRYIKGMLIHSSSTIIIFI